MSGPIATLLPTVRSYLADLAANPSKPASALLPLFFQIRGRPFNLQWSHFMFEPIYRVAEAPRQMVCKTGRQVGKTTNISASQILRAALIPYYTILTVLPRFEQTRVFSQNNVAPLLNTSPLKRILTGAAQTDAVLQRDIGRGSKLYYGYSMGDPSRLRGRAVDEVNYDEVQSLEIDDFPVIDTCMSASPYKIRRLTGTPLTFDNTLQIEWNASSQGIWHIPCVCGKVNACTVDGDLLQMIGDGHFNDGTPRTLICAKCGRPANSRAGYYVHSFPSRRASFSGIHVPQVILPMHYESPKDWQVILDFRDKKPTYAFYNEVLGESYDAGAKMLTAAELQAAAIVEPATPSTMRHGTYIMTSAGVDWGGRGRQRTSDTEEFVSNTAVALCGMRSDGVIEVPWIHKTPYTIDHFEEARLVAGVANDARVNWLAMDYGGQGNVLEELVKSNGVPAERMVPFTYSVMGNNKPIVLYTPPTHHGVRSSYTLDKPRSLLLLCELIKRKLVQLPAGAKYCDDHLKDFFAIYLESTEDARGSMRRLVKRIHGHTDDVVHAINFGVMALYHATNRWPALAASFVEADRIARQAGFE